MSDAGQHASEGGRGEADGDLPPSEAIRVHLWASELREKLTDVMAILDQLRSGRRDDADITDALSEMHDAVSAIKSGQMPSEAWQVQLTLRQQFSRKSERVSYSLSVDEGGLRLGCLGSDCIEGRKAENWTGARFELCAGEDMSSEGEWASFVAEFQRAIHNTSFALSVSFDGQEVGFRSGGEVSDITAAAALARVTREVVSRLHALPDDSSQLLFGDSGLSNFWDEICVQQQSEQSHSWELYVQMVEAIIADEVEKLDPVNRQALWLLTDEASECIDDDPPDPAKLVPCDSETCGYVFGRLMSVASDYSNPRIIRFLNGRIE